MRLMWMGTASLLFAEGDEVVAFDPFPGIPIDSLRGQKRTVPDAALYLRAGNVFATHGHFDHILFIPALYGRTDTVIHATATPCETLQSAGFPAERLHTIAPGWEGAVGPFRLRALQGRHCRFDAPIIARTLFRRRLWQHLPHMLRLLSLNRQHPENGETLFYELTDGRVRVQILGSLGLDAGTDYPTGADWLILPFQGRSDLSASALPIVERLAPKAVLLDHYDDSFPPMSAKIPTEDFAALLEARGIPCRPLEKHKTLTL